MPLANIIPFELPLPHILPTIEGNVDYRDFRDQLLRIDALVDILATVNPNIKNETRAARRTALVHTALKDGIDIIQILVRTFNIR